MHLHRDEAEHFVIIAGSYRIAMGEKIFALSRPECKAAGPSRRRPYLSTPGTKAVAPFSGASSHVPGICKSISIPRGLDGAALRDNNK